MPLNTRPPKKRRDHTRPTVKFQDGDGNVVPVTLKYYTEKIGHKQWDLYICLGEKCPRGPAAKMLSKHACERCLKADPHESVGSILSRIKAIVSEPHPSQN